MSARAAWDAPRYQDALELHAAVGPIDLHVDPIIVQRLFRYDIRRRHRALLRAQPFFWHSDVPRLRDARFGGVCLGIHYWPWESERAWREMLRQIDYLDRVAEEDPDCMRVRTPSDWAAAREAGLLALAPGVEGAHMLNGRVERVAELAKRGVSYLTLAHFCRNRAVTSSMGRGSNPHDGMTDWGRELVAALNAHGIVVDVAHVNMPGVLDTCRAAQAPVMCTHTGVKAVHDHVRNLSTEAVDAIVETGGAIGVMYAPGFLSGRAFASTEVVLDHMQFIIERAGIDHVCLGSDYDGWLPTIPHDHRDCRDTVRITDGLLARGYSSDDVAKVLRHNALRVFQAAWDARQVEP